MKAMFPNTNPHPEFDPETKRERKRRSVEGVRAKALGLKSPCLCKNYISGLSQLGVTLPPLEDKSIIDVRLIFFRLKG